MVKLVFLRDEWFGDFGNWLGREYKIDIREVKI
jgi:hypothetical protein